MIAEGIVKEHRGKYELHLRKLTAVQIAQNYPITPKEHGPDYLLDRRHLWIRSKRQHAILRIRHELIRACHEYFYHQEGWYEGTL